ncbi:MAG: dienelactone hydrolase family protein [Spirochaetales bacterium]|nr:dienelactone hydrolase family protein [Spirochaetales bacterium]
MKKYTFRIFIFIAALVFTGCVHREKANEPAPVPSKKVRTSATLLDPLDARGTFIRKLYTNEKGTLPFRFFIPENTDPNAAYPLLVYFHGAGEMGTDNVLQLNPFPREFIMGENLEKYKCYIMAPQCSPDNRWIDFSGGFAAKISNSMAMTIDVIEGLLDFYNIDKGRIYVTGISLGGMATFDLAGRRPDLVAAALPVCGIADPAKIENLKKVPLWIFHGGSDETVPVEYSRSIVRVLTEAGFPPRYSEYPGVGHISWPNAYAEPEFWSWMFSRHK